MNGEDVQEVCINREDELFARGKGAEKKLEWNLASAS